MLMTSGHLGQRQVVPASLDGATQQDGAGYESRGQLNVEEKRCSDFLPENQTTSPSSEILLCNLAQNPIDYDVRETCRSY